LHILRCSSLRQWREEYVPLSGVMADFERHDDAPFRVTFSLPIDLPGVLECRFSPGTCVCTSDIKTGHGWFKFMIAKSDGTHHVQRGRQLQLDHGEATLLRGNEPSRNGSPTDFQGIAVVVPQAEFEARSIRPDDAVMRRVSPQREALGLLRSYLRSLGRSGIDRTMAFGVQTATREAVRRHILELAVLAVSWQGMVGESDLGSVAEARLQAAHDYIAAHFRDPGLTIEKVARSQNISARYLRQLLESSGQSYTAVVNELRLQKAFSALSVDRDGRSILDFAMEAGFSDISHFNRLFRARFGDTPSGVRGQRRRPL